jgi:16S rRNA (cytidine1402-2'-O)-methyltransferase
MTFLPNLMDSVISFVNQPIVPGLYLVATPIGNASDISLRALAILAQIDMVYAEDTRVTQKLLGLYGLKKPVRSYHDHNADQIRPEVLEKLSQGQKIALVSDAGTPLISDPGYKLVRACTEKGFYITALPGACALIDGLILSGLPTDSFCFGGFLPNTTQARQKVLADYGTSKGTLIFYDTATRLINTLEDILKVYGNVPIAVARELTKKFEEVKQGLVQEVFDYYQQHPLKGEIVLFIGDRNIPHISASEKMLATILEYLPTNPAAELTATLTGENKRALYQKALELKKHTPTKR